MNKRKIDGECFAYYFIGDIGNKYFTLGFNMKDKIPLERCPKPKNIHEYNKLLSKKFTENNSN